MSILENRTIRDLLLAAGAMASVSISVTGCCMAGGSSPSAPAPLPAFPTPSVAPAAPGGTQVVTIGAGFAPDPTVATTIAGGGIAASSLVTDGTYCAGNVGMLPNVSLTTTTPIAGLRVLVRSSEDTTIMVRLSDGRVLCDDDGGGYPNPAVLADFPAGTHQIYVGTFHSGDAPLATVGFTTNPALPNVALP